MTTAKRVEGIPEVRSVRFDNRKACRRHVEFRRVRFDQYKLYGGPGGRATRRCLCGDGDATIDDDDATIDDGDSTIDYGDAIICQLSNIHASAGSDTTSSYIPRGHV